MRVKQQQSQTRSYNSEKKKKSRENVKRIKIGHEHDNLNRETTKRGDKQNLEKKRKQKKKKPHWELGM